jgi:chemotaxis protein CheX
LKVEYMEPFVRAACSVLDSVSNGSAKAGSLGLQGSTFPAASINVAARIDGSLRGDVVYSMSSQTAQRLAGLILGSEAHGFGRLTGNGLSRLGDMFADSTRNLLSESGLNCRISSATVFQGLNVEFSAAAPALSVPIHTDAGDVEVNVAVRDGEQS